MAGGPRSAVTPRPKRPPIYSLVSSSAAITEPDDRWVNGLAFRPEACRVGGLFDPCGSTTKTAGVADNPGEIDYQPFGVWAPASCSTFSQERVRGLDAEARRALLACESRQIARELMMGTFAIANEWPNNYLRNGPLLLGPGGGAGASPTDALSCLEQALAECGCGEQGMIHATRQQATLWAAANLVTTDGRLMTTRLGTIVVPDAGYTGDAPVGVTDVVGATWAYATSMVEIRLSDVAVYPGNVASATDRATNVVTFRAERAAAATWDDCCHAAIAINVPPCGNLEFAS